MNELAIKLPRMRLARDDMWLGIARVASGRAECTRRRVGAILVRGLVSVSPPCYNGAPAGKPSCLDGACPRGRSGVAPGSSYDTGPGACIALHAEQNAIMLAAPQDRVGAILYVTEEPCDGCWRMIRGSGVERVVFDDGTGTVWHREIA